MYEEGYNFNIHIAEVVLSPVFLPLFLPRTNLELFGVITGDRLAHTPHQKMEDCDCPAVYHLYYTLNGPRLAIWCIPSRAKKGSYTGISDDPPYRKGQHLIAPTKPSPRGQAMHCLHFRFATQSHLLRQSLRS